MPSEITMPQLSDTMSEGTLVKWRKKEGDKVKAGEIVADVETDKATMEMESFDGGTLAAIVIKEGEKAAVGAVIGVLATGSEKLEDVKKKYAASSGASASAPAPAAQAATTTAAQPVLVAAGKEGAPGVPHGAARTLEGASLGELHEPDHEGHGATREVLAAHAPEAASNGGRVKVTPLARRIAADRGIPVEQVKGTGPGGRVIQRDVLDWKPSAGKPSKSSAPSRPLTPSLATGEKRVIPLDKMRLAISAALQRSKQLLPHFYETIDIDVEDLSNLRVRLNEQLKRENIKLSLGDLIAKAVASALIRHPELNATFDGQQVTQYGDVNLGIAVALASGLIVPVLRGVSRMGAKEIRQRSEDLVNRARGQKLKREELSGATFTVSNLGAFGIREFSAIINPPEVGILAIGSAEKRAVVRDNQIVARTTMSVTLSADHRVVDGSTAAEFLRSLKSLLEDPGSMLL